MSVRKKNQDRATIKIITWKFYSKHLPGGEGHFLIWPKQVCATEQGTVFKVSRPLTVSWKRCLSGYDFVSAAWSMIVVWYQHFFVKNLIYFVSYKKGMWSKKQSRQRHKNKQPLGCTLEQAHKNRLDSCLK